jgi:hypothetical protein
VEAVYPTVGSDDPFFTLLGHLAMARHSQISSPRHLLSERRDASERLPWARICDITQDISSGNRYIINSNLQRPWQHVSTITEEVRIRVKTIKIFYVDEHHMEPNKISQFLIPGLKEGGFVTQAFKAL